MKTTHLLICVEKRKDKEYAANQQTAWKKSGGVHKMLAKRGRKASYEQPERYGVTIRQQG